MTPEQLQERETRLRKAFLENDFGDAVLRLNSAAEAGFIENKDAFLKASAVAGWAGSQMGKPVNPASPDWQGIKDGIARGYFKRKDAQNVTDDDIFAAISDDYKAQDAAFEAAKDAAARGESWLGKFREKEAASPTMAGGRQASYLGMTRQIHDAFRQKILPYKATIDSVTAKARSIQTNPEGFDWGSMADELIKVPKEDRPFVLEAISRQTAQVAETGTAQNLMINFDRGLERYLDTAVAGLERFGESQLGRFIRSAQGFDIQAQTPEQIEQRAQYLDLRDDLRGIATGKLAKLNDVRLLGMNLSGAARNAAMTLGAFVPYVGPAAMVGSFARETANEIRQQNPTMSREDAEQIAMVSAPFQAATEVVSERLLFGKLPSLKRLFTQPVFSAGGVAAQVAARVGVGTGTEIAEELTQGVIPRVVQALKDDVPAVDWDGYFSDFAEQSPEMLAEILPMALLGAGVGQLSDYRAGRELIQNRDLLVAAKLTPEDADAISSAAQAGDFDTAESLLKVAWPKIAKAGEGATEIRSAAIQSHFERSKQLAAANAQATAEAEAMGVAAIRDASGWKVRMADGTTVPVESAEAAARMQKDMVVAASEYEAETTIAAVDELLRLDPTRRVEITSEIAQAGENGLTFTNPITGQIREVKDTASLQNLREEQMALADKEGEADVAQTILGMNKFEYGNAILTVFQRGLNKDGTANIPRIITALHEHVEASWRKGVAFGKFTEQESRNAVASLISQLDPKKLGKKATKEELNWLDRASRVARGEGDENLLREVISELAVRTWIGRDKTGERTGMTPGTILRALDSAVLTAKKPAEMSVMRRIRAWVKAVGAYLRGVVATAKIISQAEQNGTVGDFTEFMDKLLGLTEQTREDAAQADQIRQQMEADGMAFSLADSRATPTTQVPVVEMPDGAQLLGPATFSIRAYHGTPHKVDKFSTEKIGTGEGAQAYGWGLYFAESKGVAEDYKAKLGKSPSQLRAARITVQSWEREVAANPSQSNKDQLRMAQSALDEMEANQGNLYTVELLPDESEFLDWDKPLSEQSEKVKAALQAGGIMAMMEERESSNTSGVPLSVYAELAWDLGEKKASERLASIGIPGIKYLDAGSRGAGDGTRNYVIFDEKLVKILEENGKPVGSTFSLSPITPDQDAEYMEAVNAGDTEKAQRMVDEAAKAAGYETKAFHGTSGDWSVFDAKRIGSIQRQDFGRGIYLAPEWRKNDAQMYARQASEVTGQSPKVLSLWVKTGRSLKGANYAEEGSNLTGSARDRGYDSVIVKYDRGENRIGKVSEIIVLDPSQIKSADPVTYDDAGNVIPLSQRFNPESADIRFSLSPTSSAEQLANIIESIMQARPELAFKIRQRSLSDINRLIQNWSSERVTWKGDKIRPVVEKRTKASLDKEQAVRQATREAELVDAGMSTLTPETLMAWSEGIGQMADHPLIKQMLGAHGRLMSKTTAENLGKLKTDGKGKAGDYDGAGWLPPAWYAGAGAGIMPDVMAQNLYDDGLLNEPTPDALWNALNSVVVGQRAARAEFAKAESAVKDVEKKAKSQAKSEAQQWRDETEDMMQDDWSPRESLQRDARLFNTAMAAFPAEIRGKIVPGGMVKLTGQATERARYKTIEKAMQKAVVELEKFMKKEITQEVDSLLDRYSSQKGASGRMEGKLLSHYTELVDYANFIRNADIETVANEEKALDAAIADSQDADETASLMSKIGVLRQFELWSDKDSASMADAMKWLQDIVATGKLGKKILDEERKAMLDELRGDAIKGALPDREVSQAEADNETTAIQSSNYRKAAQALRGMMSSILWTTAQRLELLFGEDSKVTRFFADRLVSAANQETDILRNIDAQRREALSVIFDTESTIAQARAIGKMQAVKKSGVSITEGRKTESVKLDIETLTKLSDGTMAAEAAGLRQDQVETALEEWAASDRKRTVTVEKVLNAGELKPLDMSEMQGIQYLLWSRQDASRKQMERDGWTEDSFKQLDEFLSSQAVALANWMSSSYDAAAKMIDPVYRRLFNAPLPRIKNYAPIYRHRSGDASVMELDGSDISSGMTAGFTKSRVNTTSPLMRMDAMAVFLGHWQNVAHWVSHAEIMRDTKAVLLDKNVQTAIRQKSGDASLTNLKTNIANIEAAGTRAVKDIVFLSRFWQNLMQYRAFKALAFRISPVAKQTSAVLNPLLADVPAHSYSVGLARALTSPVEFASDVSAMWKSDIIQRRIQGGFSAEARVAMQNAGVNGSMFISMMQKGMLPMAWTDAGWTAIGSAIAFDYYRRSYFAENSNATAEQADSYAAQRLERMIATSAQPSDLVNRSIAEQSTNIFAKAMWMFLSDQRKAAAIELMAIKRLASGKSKNKAMDIQRILVAHVAQAAVTQLSVAILASVLGKPEDEEREWSREQWAATLALGPVGGIFVLGRGIEYGVKYLLGLRVFGETTLTEKVASDVYRAGRDINDLFSDDPEDVVNELDKLSSATGSVLTPIFGPQAGAVDVMANLAREYRKIDEAVSREE